MPALNCFRSKENGRENVASPTDQPAEPSVLPPFSGTLIVDEELKLSNENFKQSIENFFKDKNITPLSQLTATPPFPTPYVLAQFASKAYTDYNRQETDAQYESRLALPDGWKLLTTASNTGMSNGYFGAAYWHPEHQQVVIAHRGTELTNLEGIFTDISGVLFKHHVSQMGSASTFAYKVVEVLREVNKEKETYFQVFFSGHSLGGWLAQITAFTTKYLKIEGNTFLKCDNVPHSYHPHTVVFDSPGCKDMLTQMADKVHVSLKGRSIDLEHLDITSYLSAPNRVNTCNKHAGTVYRVFSDLSDIGWQEKHTALYNLTAHDMGKIVEVFDPETGQVYRDEQGKLKVQVVIDWPLCGFRRDEEYKRFFKWAEHLNNYNPDIKEEIFDLKGYHPIRYQTKNYDERVTSISIFSREERQFLEDYRRLCQLPELFKPKDMFSAIGNEQAQKQAEIILQGFEIDNETIRCTDVSALQALIPYVKRLLQLFPEIKENTTCVLNKAEQSVLPPFSGKLSVDEELKLSNETLKQTIDDFFKDKYVTALSQLTATPAFPTPYVLAYFASKAYTDYNKQETDAQYETRLKLPDGWKLLTTASNTGRNNGYFGAAYWHPEHHQVVIAHRGTDPKKWGPLWTDIQGVLRNKYVGQMESASTFAHTVVEVLRDVDNQKGTNFQVFFTGHSLGSWLAQITTFTTEYLKTEGNNFLKSDTVPHSYHPHTVVFDSPGCKDMLSQMADTLDVRIDGRSIDLEHLDITSYLSAPNRINTCNKHVGTVYRVFTDLSDMPWWKKYTALYNLAAHDMGKIVKIFDPESVQVPKNENGHFKLQMVIDWPVSDGVSRGKEYKSFFKWAKDLNNYHTEITVENKLIKGCYPIRYQTKNYDERVTSISIFSREERQFLEDYRRLCQLPEFFKPKEMFSPIGNNEAQEEAEKILQSFEIENETIRCTDASALQALIPYVKRLLQLFPEIKENTKCALSPHENRNNVYQIGTKRYLEKLHQSPLDFKPDALSLRDFLNSDEQKVLHLRMVDGDAWTGLIKVCQVLQKTPSMNDLLSEGHYTVLTLQHLLLVNTMVNLNTLMESTTTPHLLMMVCETNQLSNAETTQIFDSLFNTLKKKKSVKTILITQLEGDPITFLQDIAKEILSNGFVTRDELLTWSDLTQSSQEELLENAVNFQGSEIALNQVISPDSPVTNLLPIADLLGKIYLKIGIEPVSNSKCEVYDERYYIKRTFHHQVIIKQEVLNDNREQTFPDLLASTEQDFKQLCQQNPTDNVHWLERDKSGKLVWQQSEGSLEALRKYIDTHISHTYTADDLDKLLEQAQHERVMLISDTAGMGKSTVVTHLSKQIKQKFPAKWVVRIDLNDHTDALEALKKEQIGKEKAIEFVSKKLLKLEPGLEMELFKQCCEQKQNVDIVIMLDGFDEISPSYKETVIALLQALRQTAVEQLWVTTRPHLRKELEDQLQHLSYKLEPFSEVNQVEFLTNFWSLKDWFTEMDSKEEEEKKVKLASYAKHLIKKLAQSISDKDKEFTGIPLQCRMLAEAFDEEVKTFCQSAESLHELPSSLDLIGLYENFINRKYDICFEEKFKISMTISGAKTARKQFVKNMTENHQILALKMLLAEEQVALLQINSQCTSSDEDLTRTGIVQLSHDGKLHFIHRTFADYYVAEFLVNRLTKWSYTSQQMQDLIFQKIFLEKDYRVIRAFIDGLLSRSNPPKEVLKQYGNRISDFWKDGLLILHQAVREGNVYIIVFLLDIVQAGEHTDTVNELLLDQDNRHIARQLAKITSHTEILE